MNILNIYVGLKDLDMHTKADLQHILALKS